MTKGVIIETFYAKRFIRLFHSTRMTPQSLHFIYGLRKVESLLIWEFGKEYVFSGGENLETTRFHEINTKTF